MDSQTASQFSDRRSGLVSRNQFQGLRRCQESLTLPDFSPNGTSRVPRAARRSPGRTTNPHVKALDQPSGGGCQVRRPSTREHEVLWCMPLGCIDEMPGQRAFPAVRSGTRASCNRCAMVVHPPTLHPLTGAQPWRASAQMAQDGGAGDAVAAAEFANAGAFLVCHADRMKLLMGEHSTMGRGRTHRRRAGSCGSPAHARPSGRRSAAERRYCSSRRRSGARSHRPVANRTLEQHPLAPRVGSVRVVVVEKYEVETRPAGRLDHEGHRRAW